MKEIRKTVTEADILEMLRDGQVTLPPLNIRCLRAECGPEDKGSDCLLEIAWGQKKARFAAEIKALSTPKAFEGAVSYLKTSSRPRDFLPLVVLPYLNADRLKELEQAGISGVDLCGNGIVTVAGGFQVLRTGQPNRFSSSAVIKNIYRKNSSLVGRVFLARSQYDAIKEVVNEIRQRSLLVTNWRKSPLTFATVSKAIASMGDDLIIGRNDGRIRLLQADKLLEKLCQNYAPPVIRERLRLKVESGGVALTEFLARQAEQLSLPLVATGASSVGQYAVMQRSEMLSVYCPRLGSLPQQLRGRPDDRFANLELIESEDDRLYFDSRDIGGFRWASPVQVYLELMAGDKRDQETADQVRDKILRDIEAGQS